MGLRDLSGLFLGYLESGCLGRLYIVHVSTLHTLDVGAIHVTLDLHITLAPGASFEMDHLWYLLGIVPVTVLYTL